MEQERMMILNHKEAICYVVDQAQNLRITQEVICTLHYLLSEGLLEFRESGKIRRHAVRIGGSTYLPFEDPKQLEIQLERIVSKADLIQDPYEQSFFLLIHVSYLQALADVNKRTARLAANIPLIQKNLVPVAFHGIASSQYMSSMIAVYELQRIEPLVDLFAHSYMQTLCSI